MSYGNQWKVRVFSSVTCITPWREMKNHDFWSGSGLTLGRSFAVAPRNKYVVWLYSLFASCSHEGAKRAVQWVNDRFIIFKALHYGCLRDHKRATFWVFASFHFEKACFVLSCTEEPALGLITTFSYLFRLMTLAGSNFLVFSKQYNYFKTMRFF